MVKATEQWVELGTEEARGEMRRSVRDLRELLNERMKSMGDQEETSDSETPKVLAANIAELSKAAIESGKRGNRND